MALSYFSLRYIKTYLASLHTVPTDRSIKGFPPDQLDELMSSRWLLTGVWVRSRLEES